MKTVMVERNLLRLEEDGRGGYYASLRICGSALDEYEIKGSPLGRGGSMAQATTDLIRRIESESRVTVMFCGDE